jgi:hypothetical protein
MSFKQFDNKCNALLKLLNQTDAGISSRNLSIQQQVQNCIINASH